MQNAQTKKEEADAKTGGAGGGIAGATNPAVAPPGTFAPINLQQQQGQ
jgi:hypothetical protein